MIRLSKFPTSLPFVLRDLRFRSGLRKRHLDDLYLREISFFPSRSNLSSFRDVANSFRLLLDLFLRWPQHNCYAFPPHKLPPNPSLLWIDGPHLSSFRLWSIAFPYSYSTAVGKPPPLCLTNSDARAYEHVQRHSSRSCGLTLFLET